MAGCLLAACGAPASAQAWIRAAGGAAWIDGAAGRRDARAGLVAQSGEKLVTGADGRLELILADASAVKLGPSSTLKIERSRVSTTAVSLRAGTLSAATTPYKWRNEAFQISTPVVTTGVRGTEFSVEVAATGEARIHVETGVVTAGSAAIGAGEGAAASYDGALAAAPEPEPAFAAARWRENRAALLRANRKRVVEGITALLRDSLDRRRGAVENLGRTIREVIEALKDNHDDLQDAGVAKIARAVTAIRNGVDRAREWLANDREGELREDALRGILKEGGLPPLAALGAQLVLNRAEKERFERERGLRQLDDAVEKLGGGLVLLASIAAAEPGRERVAGKIIADGLGIPIAADPIPDARITLSRADILWSPGVTRKMLRTVRGREDFRAPLEVTVAAEGRGVRVTRAPLAFDSTASFTSVATETCQYLHSFPGTDFVTPARPAMMYRFPMRVGDTWVAWTVPGIFNAGRRIERAVTAAERIRTAAGEFDCLRVETRFRQQNARNAPLIHVEWLASGIGQVREISFRHEIGSIQWDELLEIPNPKSQIPTASERIAGIERLAGVR